MRSSRCVAFLLLAASTSHANDLSIRFGNGQSASHGLFDFTPSSDGKILQMAYTHLPWKNQRGWVRNLYIEGAVGIESEVDFGEITSTVFEISPGARVSFGSMRVWLSHGLVHFGQPRDKPMNQFTTRFGVGFVDSVSGVSIGLERSHYSTGDVAPLAFSGADYVGFTLSVPIEVEQSETL